MTRTRALGLMVLCTAILISSPGLAASSVKRIELSKTPIDYSPVRPASDGQFHDGLLFAEQSDGTLTYYNTRGQEAFTLPDGIKPLSDFFEQRALVINKTTKRIGYINTKGVLAIPCTYTEGGYFSEGVAHVSIPDSDKQLIIDRSGKIVHVFLNKYASDFYFTDGLAVAYAPEGGKMGFVNTSGELTIPYLYTHERGFSEGLAVVQNSKGKYGYIDAAGKTVIPFQYRDGGDFSEGLAAVKNSKGKWGYINTSGKTVIPFKYKGAGNFSEGLAIAYNSSGKAGFIDKNGKLIIAYQQYNRAFNFKEGVALVGIESSSGSDGKFGYMDRQGQLLTALEYRVESSSFHNGAAVAFKTLGKGFILTKSSNRK
ncbi:WG repeat-containing protein [Paenibacillus rhizophilus]|uniref:WG repeat-containing protein n=2 Tax=Paenibacillus rhizophilus TaxID=1850366 RepID=A0A3N9NZ88_9BACL|nr:WG repeat-containing protein [Paenibacillus rhizophilus]